MLDVLDERLHAQLDDAGNDLFQENRDAAEPQNPPEGAAAAV